MDKTFIARLACPMCQSTVLILEKEKILEDKTLESGLLRCYGCQREYPIRMGIPFLYSDDIREFVESNEILEWTSNDVGKILEEGKQNRKHVVEANVQYHNRVSQRYEEDYSTRGIFEKGRGTYTRIQNLVNYLVNETEHDLWVDVGCGTGNVLQHVIERFDDVVGIDVSIGMLKIAEKRKLPVMLGDGGFLPFPNNSVDVVSAFSVLHHLHDPTEILKEAGRVLKPGGYFYSDWDPNPRTQRQPRSEWSCFYNSYSKFAHQIRSLFNPSFLRDRNSCQMYCNENIEAISCIAEYYGKERKIKDPDDLKCIAKKIGFRNVQVYFHDNADNLFRSSPGVMITMKRLGHLLMNFRVEWPQHDRFAWKFAILARK